jgi:16S rRNA (cytosine967-C5)-methyltransferase
VQEKIYPAHFFAIHEAVQEIFTASKMADKTLERILKAEKNRGSKDRAVIAFWVYELIRWHRLASFLAGTNEDSFEKGDTGKRISALCKLNNLEIPELRECKLPDENLLEKNLANKTQWPHAILASIPDWLENLGSTELGEKWPHFLSKLNTPAPLHVRINRLKYDSNTLPTTPEFKLLPWGSDAPDACFIPGRPAIFRHALYKDGIIEVQDAGSQQISSFLQVEPGMRVIDACAGAGGKSLHISALMKNSGRLISMDVYEYKLAELKRRARRAGASNIETRLIQDSKSIKRLTGQADRMLLDVPCSGLGVLKRNPDAKWKLSPEFIQQIKDTQYSILSDYSRMLKPGGKLVYATCSILPSENENQVIKFLSEHPEFELEDQKSLFPDKQDGFYMARLRKMS